MISGNYAVQSFIFTVNLMNNACNNCFQSLNMQHFFLLLNRKGAPFLLISEASSIASNWSFMHCDMSLRTGYLHWEMVLDHDSMKSTSCGYDHTIFRREKSRCCFLDRRSRYIVTVHRVCCTHHCFSGLPFIKFTWTQHFASLLLHNPDSFSAILVLPFKHAFHDFVHSQIHNQFVKTIIRSSMLQTTVKQHSICNLYKHALKIYFPKFNLN